LILFYNIINDHGGNKMNINDEYNEYVNKISTPIMASSLEYVNFLIRICNELIPRNVLDLGSGFSSFALRKYTKSKITTVDTDREWLSKTDFFLKEHDLPRDNLFTLQEFFKKVETFDIISFDIGYYQNGIRQQILPNIINNYIDPNSHIVFDDMHIMHYQMFVLDYLSNFNFVMINAKGETLDNFGRYALLFTGIKKWDDV
jgi:hypothetical protein